MAPHLIYAMMRQESRFDDKAVSSAGAVGLMQLMPATGEQVADELGFPDGAPMNLLAPQINLTFGIWYASNLLERTAGDELMMLASYNAGYGNAKRWFGVQHSKEPVIEKVENVDYNETRSYIKNIVESARVYHAFYFDSDRDVLGLIR
jgi:soluble lytic murein transglycosylase